MLTVHDYDRGPASSRTPGHSRASPSGQDLGLLTARRHDDLDAVEVLGQGERG